MLFSVYRRLRQNRLPVIPCRRVFLSFAVHPGPPAEIAHYHDGLDHRQLGRKNDLRLWPSSHLNLGALTTLAAKFPVEREDSRKRF